MPSVRPRQPPSGPPPTTFAEVARAVGDMYAARGRVYATTGRVLGVSWDPDGQRLHGRVRGSGARTYRTVADWGGAHLLGGDCSCPVEVDCKHVAALVLHASDLGSVPLRERGVADRADGPGAVTEGAGSMPRPGRGVAARVPDTRRWDELLGPSSDGGFDETTVSLGILLTVRRAVHGASAGLAARLVRPSPRGWVNGNLDWQTLSPWSGGHGAHGAQVIAHEHVRIGRALRSLAMASSPLGGYGSPSRELELGGFEHPQLWTLLRDAVDAGIALRTGRRGEFGVEMAREPAVLTLDITDASAAGADGALRRLTPSVQLSGVPRQPVMFVGPATVHGVVLLPAPAQDDDESTDDGDAAADRGADPSHDGDGANAVWTDDAPALVLAALDRPAPRRLATAVLDATPLEVPADDDERFVVDGWLQLRHHATITSSDDSFTPPTLTGPTLVVHCTPTADGALGVDWSFRYEIGDRVRERPVTEPPSDSPWSDESAESVLIARASPVSGPADLLMAWLNRDPDDAGVVLADEDAIEFVTRALPALEALPGVEHEASGPLPDFRDATDELEVQVATRPLGDDRDWFGLDVKLSIDGQKVDLGTVFTALAEGRTRLLLPGGAHISLESPRLRELRALIEEAEDLAEQLGQDPDGQLRISRYQADLWEQLAALGIVTGQAEAWQASVAGLLADPTVHDIDPSASLKAELRSYQREGVAWLAFLADHSLGGILADDMGLGKTLQALAMIAHAREARPDDGPFLVLAPSSVVHGWADEAARFAPHLQVRVADATFKKMGTTAAQLADGADLVITSYTRFRLDDEAYRQVGWAGLVLDEAQAVKNHRSKLYGCVRRLGAPQALAITGTPMENNLMELWSLLSITAPGLFPNPSRFKEVYLTPIERNGDREVLARLRRKIRPLVLRRTKEQVAADLPPKQEQVLEVPLTPAHRKVYDQWLQRERRKVLGLMGDLDEHRFTVLRSLTLLRLASLHAGLVEESRASVSSAKLDALVEHLHEVRAGGHRALVFSQFTSFLGMVRDRLGAEGIGFRYLDGSTTRREAVVRSFREGEDPVFLISLKAGGVGLTLTEADYVFLMDPWWNPATEAQAIDRTHRIGQTRPVMVYRLIAADTVEQKVLELSRRKADLVDGILDEGRAFDGRLTADDVQALFDA